MLKNKKLLKALLVPSTIICGTCFSSCSVLNQNGSNALDYPIPYYYFSYSDAQKTVLSGFAPGITMQQIRDAGYTSLHIPDNVLKIESNAFAFMFDGQANYVNSIHFNDNLVEIGPGAFQFCDGIYGTLDFSNTKIKQIGNQAFFHCGWISGVKFVDDNTPPENDTLETIGQNAFEGCLSLGGTITLPRTLENMGHKAFYECEALESLNLTRYDSVPSWPTISRSVFASAFKDKCDVTVRAYMSLSDWQQLLDPQFSSAGKAQISYYRETQPDDFTYDPNNSDWITGIAWPKTIHDFDVITIPSNVVRICSHALESNGYGFNPYKIQLNEKLETIDSYAFANYNALQGFSTDLSFPSSVANIGERAFYNNQILRRVELPAHESSQDKTEHLIIDTEAFACSSVSELVIPSEITDAPIFPGVENYAFRNCYRLSVLDMSTIDFSNYPNWKYEETGMDPRYPKIFGGNGSDRLEYSYNLPTKGLIILGEDPTNEQLGWSASWIGKWVDEFFSFIMRNTTFSYDHTKLTTTSSMSNANERTWKITRYNTGDIDISPHLILDDYGQLCKVDVKLDKDPQTGYPEETKRLFQNSHILNLNNGVGSNIVTYGKGMFQGFFEHDIPFLSKLNAFSFLKLNTGVKELSENSFSRCSPDDRDCVRGMTLLSSDIPPTLQNIDGAFSVRNYGLIGSLVLQSNIKKIRNLNLKNTNIVCLTIPPRATITYTDENNLLDGAVEVIDLTLLTVDDIVNADWKEGLFNISPPQSQLYIYIKLPLYSDATAYEQALIKWGLGEKSSNYVFIKE